MSTFLRCTRIELSVREVRHRLGMSTREFSDALSDVCGRRWDQSQITRIETGRRRPSPELLDAIRSLALSKVVQQ